jgi:hypothetical protein
MPRSSNSAANSAEASAADGSAELDGVEAVRVAVLIPGMGARELDAPGEEEGEEDTAAGCCCTPFLNVGTMPNCCATGHHRFVNAPLSAAKV